MGALLSGLGAGQVTLHPDDFDPQNYARGVRHRLFAAFGDSLGFPLLLARGCQHGPTLVVTANVHGDEYEGVRAILETFESLDPGQMSGDLLAVPVVNGPAFWSGTRISPLDGANLARVFPGDAAGTPSQQIAWHLAQTAIARADLYLDLHSGGIRYRMPSMAGYSAADLRGRAAAEAFGASVIWGHPPPIDPGRTVSFAAGRGIPWLYTEARGAGRIHPDDLLMMRRGIRNLLCHLGILAGPPERMPITARLFGSGNTDSGLTATQAGFLLKQVDVMQPVTAGNLLGRLVTIAGEPLEEYRASTAGIIAMTREFPVVQAGDVLFLLAEKE
jgi:predicted deacylase